jgi:hypothetical protein
MGSSFVYLKFLVAMWMVKAIRALPEGSKTDRKERRNGS